MIPGFDEAVTLIARTAGEFALFYLPALAAAAALLKRGCRSTVLAGLVALAATGVYGYSVFWLWLAWARVARFVALLMPLLFLIVFIWLVWRLDAGGRRILRALLPPILLSGAFSIFVLSAGLMYGRLDFPLQSAAIRFSHALPADNEIPLIFAEGVRNEHVPKIIMGDWHLSDRPPLQAGLVLAQTRYFSLQRDLSAEVVGVIAQSTWILALWIFLTTLEIEPGVIALIFIAGLTSGFVLVNTFFVWPKLLAAAYTLGALALVWKRKARPIAATSTWAAALCGVLVALAMLSHGGAVFAFMGAVVTLLLIGVRIPVKRLAVLLGAALLLYAPWIWYQKFYDPPGDRLLKMHLAGVQEVNPRPFAQLLIEAYEAQSLHDIYHYKWGNWLTATDQNGLYWRNILKFAKAIGSRDLDSINRVAIGLRILQFFYFVPMLGFLGFAIPALLLGILPRFRTVYWRLATLFWTVIFVVIVIWCGIEFGPANTVLHAGAYATVLLAYAASCLSLWSVSPALAKTVVALQGILNFLLYGPFMRKRISEDHFVSYGDLHLGVLLLAAFAAIAVAWLIYRMAKGKERYCSAEPDSGEVLAVKTVH